MGRKGKVDTKKEKGSIYAVNCKTQRYADIWVCVHKVRGTIDRVDYEAWSIGYSTGWRSSLFAEEAEKYL